MKTPEIIERIDMLIAWATNEEAYLVGLKIHLQSSLKTLRNVAEKTDEQAADYITIMRMHSAANSSQVSFQRIITGLKVLRANILYSEEEASKPEA